MSIARLAVAVCLGSAFWAGPVGARDAAAQDVPTGSELDEPPGAVLQPPRPANAQPEARFKLKPTKDGGYDYDGTQFGARIAPDGSVSFNTHHIHLAPDGTDPSTVGIDAVTPQVPYSGIFPPAIPSMPGVTFDATDEYLRLLGQDPARDQKLAFLAATFELRLQMATRARRMRQQASLAELPGRLTALWQDPRLTPAERLHWLQAMWAELIDGPEADPARAIIRTFAQQHLSPQDAATFR